MVKIIRLVADDADRIVHCFRSVYGASYANELFYDATRLAAAIGAGRLGCVAAEAPDGSLLGHMAMTVRPDATIVELGNTVVDPAARGQGIAWQVGAELSAWCRELGYTGFLHYPTTDHHIMQRRSVKKGYEVGLMLGYIPAETDGQVSGRSELLDSPGRQAATIVYEPYPTNTGSEETYYLPSDYADRIRGYSESTGLQRVWRNPEESRAEQSNTRLDRLARRGLERLTVVEVGADFDRLIESLDGDSAPCQQVDFRMADRGVEQGVGAARAAGFWFCGWLPGFSAGDVLRLQRIDPAQTNMTPALTNPEALSLLRLAPGQT